MTAQRPPPCRGPYCAKLILLRIQFVRENLVLPNQSFTDPVLYGRPRPCRTKSESQASTSQLRQAYRCQGKRKALARPNSAKANAGHPPDQTAPGQTQGAPKAAHRGKLPPQLRQQTGTRARARRSPDQAAPGQAQDTHQDKQRRGKLPPRKHPPRQAPARGNSRHNSAKQTGAKANARRSLDQAAPWQSQDTHRDKQRRGKLSPGQTPTKASSRHNSARQTGTKASAGHPSDQAAPRQSQDTHQDKQRRGKHPPSKPIRTSNARPSGARYTNRNRQPPGRPAISVAEIRNY